MTIPFGEGVEFAKRMVIICWWFEFAHDGHVTACNKTYNGGENFANWIEEPMLERLYRSVELFIRTMLYLLNALVVSIGLSVRADVL